LDIIKKVVARKKAAESDPAQIQIKKARENFWEFCKYINPNFFKDGRPHLREIAEKLQAVYEERIIKLSNSDNWEIVTAAEKSKLNRKKIGYAVCKKIMLNEPPRHGKSYTMSLFVQWCLGKNQENRIIDVSYNETIASRFSQGVRDGIEATKLDSKIHLFSDVFPGVGVKLGDASKQIWALNEQFFNYLGTGFGGTITGIGCNIGIIDDPIKNDKEAFNDNILENHYTWYTDTFLSRIEENGIQVIIMTRWSTKDLCGRLLANEPGEWFVVCQKACVDEPSETMLCKELFSFPSYLKKKKIMTSAIFGANYQQEPVDIQGRLYSGFKTYKPGDITDFSDIISYTDTADTGADSLAHFVGGVNGADLYLLDMILTDAPMEVTEPLVAGSLYKNGVKFAVIESNNGGRGFARNVEKILNDRYGRRNKTVIHWFHQSKNKTARILSNATLVIERVYFPEGWEYKYPAVYKHLSEYQAKGNNKHDDGADSLTGIAEVLVGDIKRRGNAKFLKVRL
jgi:predicted phage terminase large subunit-like protein